MGVRRCSLSVPGASGRMLNKALGLDVDEIVADLEDSVAEDAKAPAREQVAAFLEAVEEPGPALAVRINPLNGPWGEQDVRELVRRAPGRIGSLVVPKVERAEDVICAERLLVDLGRSADGVGIQALIETAAGLLHVGEIALASPRLEALILGYADLAASLGRRPGPGEPESWLYAQETVLVAARAAGLQAIDGPYLEVRDDPGLRRRVEHVRALGFDGKWAVHPAQLAIITNGFTPGRAEIAQARSVLDALDDPAGRGAVELSGAMIDEASRKLALGVLARARAAGLEEVSR
ncbi:MAG TPA: CoA ester lyase [Solirubrobacteraceae bacterium]|nr:CoA ester lyase [Solirubrobacteraceae bacterium]